MEPLENENVNESIDNSEPIQAPKKRNYNKKCLDNLVKGREKLKEKKQKQLQDAQEYLEKMSLLKTKQIIDRKQKIKKKFGIDEDIDSDIDDDVIVRKILKPKKKKVVYIEKSDSEEEETIIKRKPKPKIIETDILSGKTIAFI